MQPELEGRPLVLRGAAGSGERVVACSHEAAALGIVRRQPIAEVMSLLQGGVSASGAAPILLPYEPDIDRQVLLQWAERCGRFSPLVGVDDSSQPDSLLMDITGTAPRFGGENSLIRQLVAGFVAARLRVRVAVAGTPSGAWAIAHFHPAFLVERVPFLAIPPGETPAALRLLPIESLRLPEGTTATLHELGVDLIGQLAALPRAEIVARLGPEPLRRWDRAAGICAEPILGVRPRPEFIACWEADPPSRQRATIDAALRHLVEQLTQKLHGAGRGATRVECRLDCLPNDEQPEERFLLPSESGDCKTDKTGAISGMFRPGAAVRFVVGLFRPTVDAKRILELLQLKLERESLVGPVMGIEVSAVETGPLVHRQLSLFDGGSPVSLEQPGGDALERLVEQLSSRLGRERVVRVRLLADAQPERAWRGEPLLGAASRRRAGRRGVPAVSKCSEGLQRFPRPFVLFAQPIALRAVPGVVVHQDIPDSAFHDRERRVGLLARFDFEGEEHSVAASWGPERIETGWWRGRPIARDYYVVETGSGRRLWLFRRLDNGRWFAHGAFD